MTVTSIRRDIPGNCSIVRMFTPDSLITDIYQLNWLLSQKESITAANNGDFEWKVNDTVLITYPATLTNKNLYNNSILPLTDFPTQLFDISDDFNSLIPIQSQNPIFFDVTPFAGGGQTNATQLINGCNKILTVLTTGDSVKLPIDVGGKTCIVQNLGSNTLNIFPYVGGSINSLSANTAISLLSGSRAIFCGMSRFNWASFINP